MLEVSDLTADADQALKDAKQATLASQADLHRQRAKVARLIAGKEEIAAEKIDAKIQGQVVNDRISEQVEAISVSLEELASDLNAPAKKGRRTQVKTQPKPQRKRQQKQPKKAVAAEDKTVLNPTRTSRTHNATKKVRSKKSHRGWRAIGQSLSDWISRRPPWLVSLASHGMLMLSLAFFTFASLQEEPFILTASICEADDLAPEIPLVQLVSWEESLSSPSDSITDLLELEAPVEMPVVEPMTIPIVESETLLASEQMPTASSMMIEIATDQSAKGSKEGTGESTETKAPATEGRVQFFGVKEEASRVVFVVDNSGSMQRGRMETTLDELNYAVQRLKEGQQFYVIFYSDQAYPMYYPNSVDSMQPATRENKKKLAKWLRTVEICLGGRLLDAIEMASKLDPQVVFLMSDGDIRSQRVMQSLTDTEAWDFRIHSFGMEVRTKQHAENLAAIAQANEGAFTVVDVRPKAIRRSMVKPIPYHREPGEVWGSAVQVWN